MKFFWTLISGFASGIFAGMGMGGGTFLIPLLTLCLNIDNKVAQATNLIVFLPMAVVVIFIYAKKHLIDFKVFWLISLPATIFSALGAIFALNLPEKILRIVFGVFLIVVALLQIIFHCFSHSKIHKMHKN
jgi:hypothetical protein